MGVHIGENKLAIITGHKTFHCNLFKDVDKNLNHETEFIITRNEALAEHFHS